MENNWTKNFDMQQQMYTLSVNKALGGSSAVVVLSVCCGKAGHKTVVKYSDCLFMLQLNA